MGFGKKRGLTRAVLPVRASAESYGLCHITLLPSEGTGTSGTVSSAPVLSNTKLFLFVCFLWCWDRTQSLVLTRQVLYHLSHVPSFEEHRDEMILLRLQLALTESLFNVTAHHRGCLWLPGPK
jgi:hypothetical protein